MIPEGAVNTDSIPVNLTLAPNAMLYIHFDLDGTAESDVFWAASGLHLSSLNPVLWRGHSMSHHQRTHPTRRFLYLARQKGANYNSRRFRCCNFCSSGFCSLLSYSETVSSKCYSMHSLIQLCVVCSFLILKQNKQF